jgi:feruloyl esterase
MKTLVAGLVAVMIGWAGAQRASLGAAPCEGLKARGFTSIASITQAESVPAGGLTLSPGSGAGAGFSSLPAFCRLAATLRPSSDSDIRMEVWLPLQGWNGKFEAVGNGGWAGTISYSAMGDALRKGYATAATDTGHAGAGASFALGHPEKLLDYTYRSEHEMTVTAKGIAAAFYGNAPRLSYWNGCSAGGKQGLKEAQQYPGDFDGIVAGAPAANWSGRAAQSIWINRAVHEDESSYIPPSKYRVIHQAVLDACDADDGVKDGVLEDPTRCRFDPQVLECKGVDSPACLTAPQVAAVRKIYGPVVNPRTGRSIFPGHQPGSELGWATMAGPQPFAIGLEFFKYAVFQDPNWNPRTFNFDGDYASAERVANGTINALDPNLEPFFAHGGKLVQYHGWSDPQISPGSSVEYFESVVAATRGVGVRDAYRLFMVPGMAHCRGGDGTDTFDMMGALEAWVEKAQPPERILASKVRNGTVERTRPLCPFPQVARYTGTGSSDDAGSFVCQSR